MLCYNQYSLGWEGFQNGSILQTAIHFDDSGIIHHSDKIKELNQLDNIYYCDGMENIRYIWKLYTNLLGYLIVNKWQIEEETV